MDELVEQYYSLTLFVAQLSFSSGLNNYFQVEYQKETYHPS